MNDDFRASCNFLKTATGDLKSGLKEVKYMENENDVRWAGYKFQQSIEKSFKSIVFCVDSTKFKPKHSISDLYDIVNSFKVIDLSEDERKVAIQIDKDFTKFRYPDDGEIVTESNLKLYQEVAINILAKTKEFIHNKIPKYLIEFPDFDNLEPISKLKGWQDTSLASEKMPSFEIKDKEGRSYKLFINYSLFSEHSKTTNNEKRYRLLQDNELVMSGNSFKDIYETYKNISQDKDNQK